MTRTMKDVVDLEKMMSVNLHAHFTQLLVGRAHVKLPLGRIWINPLRIQILSIPIKIHLTCTDVSVARSFDESGDNYRFWWILTLTIRLYRTRRYTPQSLNQSPMVIDLAVGTINLNNEVRVPADNRKNRQEQW
jgi:hypothetical protein